MAHGARLPVRTPSDPLGLALLGALVLHGIILLGVSFDIEREQPPQPDRSLDITLVKPQPRKPPEQVEEPQLLAQQNQQELENILSHTTRITSAQDLESLSAYPQPVQRLLRRISRLRADRLLKQLL